MKILLSFLTVLLIGLTVYSQANTSKQDDISRINNLREESRKLMIMGDYKQARKVTENELELREKVFGKGEFQTAIAYYYLGLIFKVTENQGKALKNFREAFDIYSASPQGKSSIPLVLQEIGIALSQTGNFEKGQEELIKALAAAEDTWGKESKEIIPFTTWLASSRENLNQDEEAGRLYQRSMVLSDKLYGKKSSESINAKREYRCFLYNTKLETLKKEGFGLISELEEDKLAVQPDSQAPDGDKKGDVVNGKAKSLPVPEYPNFVITRRFSVERISGVVPVSVVIGKDGSVVSAEAFCGYRQLREAAEKAARKARFEPTTVAGEAVTMEGIIVYNFKPQR